MASGDRQPRAVRPPIENLVDWSARDGNLQVDDTRDSVRVLYVSADYFWLLEVVRARGHDLLEAEDSSPLRPATMSAAAAARRRPQCDR